MNAIDEIISGLCGAPAILSNMVGSIEPRLLDRRRGDEGVWTIGEHLCHLASVQPMLLDRVRRILDEDDPEFVPFVPGEGREPVQAAKGLSPSECVGFFRARREEQVALLRELPPEAWARTARHPEYEAYGLTILARHMLMHDHWHMYRMEELWLTRDEYLSVLPG